MTKLSVDNLVYIDDYIDSKFCSVYLYYYYLPNTFFIVIEALQIDLQKNFTLLKEMDGYAQGKPIHLDL